MDSSDHQGMPRITRRIEYRFPESDFDETEGPIAMQALWRVAEQLRADDPDMPETEQVGAPMNVAWNTAFTMFGVPFMCLLVTDRPDPGTANIPTVVRLSARVMRERMLAMLEAGANLQAFTHDGQNGHVVNLVAHKGLHIVYADSEPGDSLLSAGRNAAGVDAQRFGNKHWTVTPDELMRVLVGLFVLPTDWAEVCGRPGRLRYSEVTESEFCQTSFLQVTERITDEHGRTRVTALPMGVEGNVRLEMTLDPDGGVTSADFAIRAEAALGGETGIHPVPLHFARLFVRDFLPVADQAAGERVLRGLDITFAHARMREPGFAVTPEGLLIRAFVGDEPDVRFTFELASLTVHHDDPGWITFEIDVF